MKKQILLFATVCMVSLGSFAPDVLPRTLVRGSGATAKPGLQPNIILANLLFRIKKMRLKPNKYVKSSKPRTEVRGNSSGQKNNPSLGFFDERRIGFCRKINTLANRPVCNLIANRARRMRPSKYLFSKSLAFWKNGIYLMLLIN